MIVPRRNRKKNKKALPPRFQLGQRIALDTRAGDVIGEIVECDSRHGVMASDLDLTIKYKIPHCVIATGKIRFL